MPRSGSYVIRNFVPTPPPVKVLDNAEEEKSAITEDFSKKMVLEPVPETVPEPVSEPVPETVPEPVPEPVPKKKNKAKQSL